MQSFLVKHADKMKEFLEQLCMRRETRVIAEIQSKSVDLERVMAKVFLRIKPLASTLSEKISPESSGRLAECLRHISRAYQERWPMAKEVS